MAIRDVHTSHCCIHHGCKYGDKDCTVVEGLAPQEGPCEQCGLELEGFYGPEVQVAAAAMWPDDFRAKDIKVPKKITVKKKKVSEVISYSEMETFKPGTVVVFEPNNLNPEWWNKQTKKDLLKWYGPLGYGKKKRKLFVFMCEILDHEGTPSGHCVLLEMGTGKLQWMRHTSDFRKATVDEF